MTKYTTSTGIYNERYTLQVIYSNEWPSALLENLGKTILLCRRQVKEQEHSRKANIIVVQPEWV